MKNLITISLLLMTGCLFAQTNADVENSKWVNGYYELERPRPDAPIWPVLKRTGKYCTSKKDTVLNGVTYIQLVNCNTIPNSYRGGLRVDFKRWYFYDKDSINEMLLYDFGLSIGDTLKEPFYFEQLYLLADSIQYVTRIDTQNYFGTDRRVLHFDGGNDSWSWIEGIGNPLGMLWDPFNNISAYVIKLECFSKNDSVNFGFGLGGSSTDCNLSFSLNENVFKKPIEIYPNPSNGSFTFLVNTFTGKGVLSIYNSTGKKLYEYTILQAETNVSLALKPGAYILKYKGDDTYVSSPLVIQ